MSFVPVTPAGTPLTGLAAHTAEEAKRRLMKDAAHMPYKTWDDFVDRGYTIDEWPQLPPMYPPAWYASGSGGGD